MFIKTILLIISFLIIPNFVSANNQLAVAAISNPGESGINQESGSPKTEITNLDSKINTNEIKSSKKASINMKRVFLFIFIVTLIILIIKLVL